MNTVWEVISLSNDTQFEGYENAINDLERELLKKYRIGPCFGGMLNYNTQCLKCNRISECYETIFDLQVLLFLLFFNILKYGQNMKVSICGNRREGRIVFIFISSEIK